MHTDSVQALATLRMPTTRVEEYRFTDLAPLYKAGLRTAPPPDETQGDLAAGLGFPECEGSRVVLVNGQLHAGLSQLGKLPAGIFVGSIKDAPVDVGAQLVSVSKHSGMIGHVHCGSRDANCLYAADPRHL